MPNEAEHIQLALHNIKVTSYLLAKPEFCDWTATVTFYTALHIVEAVFSTTEHTLTNATVKVTKIGKRY